MDMTTWRAPGESDFVPAWTFPDRLRKAREHAGLDQRTLAADIEVGLKTIGNYELGHVTPRRVVVRQWALRCGVSYEWLTTGQASSDGPNNGPTVSEGRTFNP